MDQNEKRYIVSTPSKSNPLLDELQKAKQDMEAFEMIMKTSRRTRPQNPRDMLQENIKRLEEDLVKYKQLLEKIDTLKFKAGDVAFHKNYGNVLVREVIIKDNYSMVIARDIQAVDGDFCYEIVTLNGPVVVPVDELLPITEMNKVLYGK